MYALYLMLSLTASCAEAPVPAPQADACGWLHAFRPGAGFEMRWTRDEKEQAVTLNRNIMAFCR